MSTLHKTDHFTARQIATLKEKAEGQEKTIARFYYANRGQGFSPTQLHEQMDIDWPKTSTRRALSNLTKENILVKTDKLVEGEHGKNEHLWKWKEQPPEQSELFKNPKAKAKYQGPYSQGVN